MKVKLLFLIILTTVSCKPYEKYYCEKNNPKSMIIIDKKNPFLIEEQSRVKKISLISENITKLKNSGTIDITNQSKPLVALISSKDYLTYTALWTKWKSKPCNEDLQKDYFNALNKVIENNLQLDKAINISTSLLNSKNIGGNNSDELLQTLKLISERVNE